MISYSVSKIVMLVRLNVGYVLEELMPLMLFSCLHLPFLCLCIFLISFHFETMTRSCLGRFGRSINREAAFEKNAIYLLHDLYSTHGHCSSATPTPPKDATILNDLMTLSPSDNECLAHKNKQLFSSQNEWCEKALFESLFKPSSGLIALVNYLVWLFLIFPVSDIVYRSLLSSHSPSECQHAVEHRGHFFPGSTHCSIPRALQVGQRTPGIYGITSVNLNTTP